MALIAGGLARPLQSPALVISLVALVFSLGGVAYASTSLVASSPPATLANPASSGVTWKTLGLLDGWQSADDSYGSGDPSVSNVDGIVYLAGSLTQPSSGDPEFAVLPAKDRPTHILYINVYAYGGVVGYLTIDSAGAIDASSPTSGGCYAGADAAECYTSLAGVSFPANS